MSRGTTSILNWFVTDLSSVLILPILLLEPDKFSVSVWLVITDSLFLLLLRINTGDREDFSADTSDVLTDDITCCEEFSYSLIKGIVNLHL